ncbi:MAG: tRNA (guanosine(46)-N7)-methyltransferase TrmB [Phycisphaerales bacterium]|nr:tRNA (guanosine(46)-N7)-methyltransferase TrmB [Phycisphaerales bacterium]
MSFGLGRGRQLDVTGVGIDASELPPLPPSGAAPDPARFDPRRWFPHPERPFEIEIGSGKGAFLLQQAADEPGTNFLGIEWAKEFWAYAADRVRRRALPNVRLLHADATEFLRWRVPDGCARVIHLYFSDPWPKARHHKRRVVQDRFLADARRVLAPGGELRIVTDHADYWAWMEAHFARWCGPNPAHPLADSPGGFAREPFERPSSAGEGEVVGTNFERKYAREGRPFHAAKLRRLVG